MKKGDILTNKYGDKRKILEVLGDLYFVSMNNDFEASRGGWTKQDLIDRGYTIPEEKWIPEINEMYWCVYLDNTEGVNRTKWLDDEIDNNRLSRNNVFKTKEEALQRFNSIMEK